MFELASLLLQAGFSRLAHACVAMGVFLIPAAGPRVPAQCVPLATVGSVTVWRQEGHPNAVLFRSGMTIDVDGAPRAYHPHDSGALNRLSGAGRPGHWWALVTKDGEPVVQGSADPAPGYFVSMTSLQNSTFPVTDSRRYVDAATIPYVALPEALTAAGQVHLGDLVAVVNQNNGKVVYAIYADQGPKDRLGEGSLCLANQLRGSPVPDAVGTRQSLPKGIVYVLFPGSGDHRPKTREKINTAGAKLFERWGGKAAVKVCLP